jgi:hypothetical protein
MAAAGLEPVTPYGVSLSVHWAVMRAIFALIGFFWIFQWPERSFPHPSTLGFFSALWAAGFIALVNGCKQLEFVSAFCTTILIKRHCIFPPDKNI